jgi:ketosteroid isomerase-like protein
MSDAAAIATKCLRAWTTNDFETTRSLLADDVTFVGALGATNGIDEYMDGIQGIARIVKAAEVEKTIAEGDDVCVFYDLVTTTPAGAVSTAAWYRVHDGKITSVRVFFDPRGIAPS